MLSRLVFRQKVIVALLLFGLFGLIVYYLVTGASRVGEIRVSVTVIPSDSRVTVNDTPISAGTLYLKPGDYIFKATKEGWEAYTFPVHVEDEAVDVGLVPSPISSEATAYLKQHPEVQLQREAIGGRNYELRGKQIAEESPIIRALPYVDVYGPFRVDYRMARNRPNGLVIEVSSSTPPGRQKFLEWLTQQGQDPTDLEIEYKDFANPFKAGD